MSAPKVSGLGFGALPDAHKHTHTHVIPQVGVGARLEQSDPTVFTHDSDMGVADGLAAGRNSQKSALCSTLIQTIY